MKLPNLPYIDRIWRIKGSLPLETPQSAAATFEKLVPLFDTQVGADSTSYTIDGDTLTYVNRNPNPQNKLATFNRGTLQVVDGGSRLRYDATSPALLFCLLAPLLFLLFSQIMVRHDAYFKPTAAEMAKTKAQQKRLDEAHMATPMNPIDEFLGAPKPEKPKDGDAPAGGKGGKGGKGTPTIAYIYAGIFAGMYIIGRIMEPWLFRRTFRKQLSDAPEIELHGHPAE